MQSVSSICRLAVAYGVLLFCASPALAQDWLPDSSGRETFVAVCTSCHSFDTTRASRRTSAEWEKIVKQMLGRDGRTDATERDAILIYVIDNFSFSAYINRATAKQLESVLRLTPKDAESIVTYRQTHGDLKNWDDLLKVNGVDPAALEAVRSRIFFDPPASNRQP